jgi:hypothetical protein
MLLNFHIPVIHSHLFFGDDEKQQYENRLSSETLTPRSSPNIHSNTSSGLQTAEFISRLLTAAGPRPIFTNFRLLL